MNERTLYQLFLKTLRISCPAAFYWKVPDTKGLGGKKCFDALLIHQGKTYCIEFKVKGRKPTSLQKYFLSRAQRAGANAVVLDETNWKSFLTQLSDTSRKSPVQRR